MNLSTSEEQIMRVCPLCGYALETIRRGDRARLCCKDAKCGFVDWNNPTPVVAVIVEIEAGVVLARNRKWDDSFYSVISGFLEEGESPTDCAIRETREELGLCVSQIDLVGVYSYFPNNQVIIAYHVYATGSIILNEELDSYKILHPQAIVPWRGGTGLAMSDWLKKRTI